MSHPFTRFVSILVLALSFAFGSTPFAAAMEPIVPNRSTGGATGGGDSAVLACVPRFLSPEPGVAFAVSTAPRDLTTSMIIVEQDNGDVYLAAGQHVPSDAQPAVQMAVAAGCLTPA